MGISWKFWLCICFLALVGGFGAGYNIGQSVQESRGEKALREQKASLESQCVTLQQKTTEIDRGLQNDLTAIADRLAASRLLTPACIVPTGRNTGNAHAAGRTRHAGQNGISTQWLRAYAAEANTYRAKVIAFQKACGQ
ncbi:hypothetical protein K3G63_04750 [Hymenobacter sp. HSC-4F20]|nr:hypothetical protein [Hymenobacter sp. HSC-4F20]